MKLIHLIKLLLPLNKLKRDLLSISSDILDVEDYKNLKYFLKSDQIFGYVKNYETSDFLENNSWAEFKTHVGGKEIQEFIKDINKKIKEEIDNQTFSKFSEKAPKAIPKLIANNIVGLEDAKFAASLMLFAKKPFHILLLGDPGTGKTEILRSVTALASKASFGLGSGTSGAGLSATYKGKELIKGLLPQAHNGIACIDELNLMKVQDRAALYNAMEKGFVTYDKGGKHEQLDAKIRVIATANPKGDKFVGQSAAILKKQLPFAQALLSRFHLVFLIRKPGKEELTTITRQIVTHNKQKLRKPDIDFIKHYIKWTNKSITFPKKFEPMVVNFIEDLFEDQNKFLVEIGPRTVVGIMRMAEAYARMQGKDEVSQEDLLKILKIAKDSFYFRK